MSMRGALRATPVEARAFAWDRALLAVLQHGSLPFGETVPATPLIDVRQLGPRDRLSLLGQFAAHEALLQFAGVADGELDPAEWTVVAKRGTDVRLVRIAARACDASVAPPVLTLAQQFAAQMNVELDVLAQPWARADAIYAEVFARLSRDIAADLRWLRQSACGEIASPGAEGLRLLAEADRYGYADASAIEAVQRYAELDGSYRMLALRGASPLERYSALGALAEDRDADAATVAERILAATSKQRHVFVVVNREAFDEGSRHVAEILSNARHGTWLVPGTDNPLSPSREFLIAPR